MKFGSFSYFPIIYCHYFQFRYRIIEAHLLQPLDIWTIFNQYYWNQYFKQHNLLRSLSNSANKDEFSKHFPARKDDIHYCPVHWNNLLNFHYPNEAGWRANLECSKRKESSYALTLIALILGYLCCLLPRGDFWRVSVLVKSLWNFAFLGGIVPECPTAELAVTDCGSLLWG
jgi:hypothetical protein